VAQLAGRQFGHVRWDQLRALGVGKATIARWIATGYLHPVLPRVYAVGHRPTSIESRLAAALLYAGPGAALSHGTATWWWGLIDDAPSVIQLSTPRRVKSLRGIRVHGRRYRDRIERHGLQVVTPSQAIADLAHTAGPERLRFVLANADYHDLLDLDELGAHRNANLRRALEIHRPELAFTRSELEQKLATLCERHDLPLPKFNVHVHGWLVDAVWQERNLIVEVDGYAAHRTRAQLERDHHRDLELRAHGYVILRYTWRQLTKSPWLVVSDLNRHLSEGGSGRML
jgi:very-short-patch-repair endonuclease